MDCESSEQFYNLDPAMTELSIENFARDRDRASARADLVGGGEEEEEEERYGENFSGRDYGGRPRARRGRPLAYGDERGRGGYNRRYYGQNNRVRPQTRPQASRRRIGSRATIIRDNGGNRQRRLPRRRMLKAIPSSSFRTEQSRKRIARQVESERKKTDELESEQQVNNNKKRNFEDEIKILREEILQALSIL